VGESQSGPLHVVPAPANSGPGRSILQGMAHILGDANPMDPEKGWDKTWAYLIGAPA